MTRQLISQGPSVSGTAANARTGIMAAMLTVALGLASYLLALLLPLVAVAAPVVIVVWALVRWLRRSQRST